nr:hypothetical protein [Candidatus Sigynarchaeum springense]
MDYRSVAGFSYVDRLIGWSGFWNQDMVATFPLPILDARPTQLYINERKLAALEARYPHGSEARMEPVPVTRLRGTVAFTDGHTRAFLAWKRGLGEIAAYWDDSELDMETYSTCFDWCQEEGIRAIADLASRIIDDAAYQAKWIARCETIGLNEKDG